MQHFTAEQRMRLEKAKRFAMGVVSALQDTLELEEDIPYSEEDLDEIEGMIADLDIAQTELRTVANEGFDKLLAEGEVS